MRHEPDPIDWDKILSKDNHTKEELTPEEINLLEEYERQQEEIRMSGIPKHVAEQYQSYPIKSNCHTCGKQYIPDEKFNDGYCSADCFHHDQV